MTPDEYRATVLDQDSMDARAKLIGAATMGFWHLCDDLPKSQDSSDGRVVALTRASLAARSLLDGIVLLLDNRQRYSAAALIRQVVEAEYLLWACAEDLDEAVGWLESTKDERLKRWAPKHLRQRSDGRFRAKDYGLHCEIGGHPTPDGVRFLTDESDSDLWTASLMYETALHAGSAFDYALDALVALSNALDTHPLELAATSDAGPWLTAKSEWLEKDCLRSAIREYYEA